MLPIFEFQAAFLVDFVRPKPPGREMRDRRAGGERSRFWTDYADLDGGLVCSLRRVRKVQPVRLRRRISVSRDVACEPPLKYHFFRLALRGLFFFWWLVLLVARNRTPAVRGSQPAHRHAIAISTAAHSFFGASKLKGGLLSWAARKDSALQQRQCFKPPATASRPASSCCRKFSDRRSDRADTYRAVRA